MTGNSPFKIHKTVYQAFRECGEYFKELSEHKSKQLAHGEEAEKGSMDLMSTVPVVSAASTTAQLTILRAPRAGLGSP